MVVVNWSGLCAAFLCLVPPAAMAESVSVACLERISEKPISIIVPNDAGGGYDTYARAFAEGLEAIVGGSIRVANMPAAGGRLALTEVVSHGPDETLLLVDNLSDVVAATDSDDSLEFGSAAFAALGTIVTEPSVWLGNRDVDLADPSLTALVVSANSVRSSLIDAGLVGRALGLDMRVVSGYDGSSETAAAVMRGEADIATMTITTALRRSQGTDLAPLLVLEDEASGQAPEAWTLGGGDGLVARRAAALSERERAERLTMADRARALTGTYRGVLTASDQDAEMLACLREVTDAVLEAPTLAEAANAEGRPVDPTRSSGTMENYEAIRASQAEVAAMLDELATEISQ